MFHEQWDSTHSARIQRDFVKYSRWSERRLLTLSYIEFFALYVTFLTPIAKQSQVLYDLSPCLRSNREHIKHPAVPAYLLEKRLITLNAAAAAHGFNRSRATSVWTLKLTHLEQTSGVPISFVHVVMRTTGRYVSWMRMHSNLSQCTARVTNNY